MKYIREQFDDFRSNTPTYVQWLLLGAAILIVVILLTLLLSREKPIDPSTIRKPVEFDIKPESIKFDNVKVGDTERAKINVSVNVPVIIESVDISEADFSTPNTCISYDETQDCDISVVYTPTKAQKNSSTTLVITWYEESAEDVVRTEKISVDFSSYEEQKPVEKPKTEPSGPIEDIRPIIEPNPFRQPEPEYEDDYEDDYDDLEPEAPAPAPAPQPLPKTNPCSEFSIPGYDASGAQIGWIKPEHGINYFYPLSDKNCSHPTGKYDMATGAIRSLKDGSWIGTDSDHIGSRGARTRNLVMPQLSAPQKTSGQASNGEFSNAIWKADGVSFSHKGPRFGEQEEEEEATKLKGSGVGESVISSMKYDRTFVLRQFKPIPATIVSEVRADPSVYGCTREKGAECKPGQNYSVPVRATVDRNVYSDDGRTIILPTGTLLMGYLAGDLPGPYQAFGRMNIRWYQFIRPDGIEFNFLETGQDPYSADAQGRMGVPGHGSTDYIEQMVMPLLTALVPAAVNMIAPIADTVINQIDLDNNTVVQSGTIRSSEMAKQDIINTWNKITQKLLVDAIDNTVPPFSIAAGTRINVFSPVDLIVSCPGSDKKCKAILPTKESGTRRKWADLKKEVSKTANDGSWVGQVRSFDLQQYCTEPDAKTGKVTLNKNTNWAASGYDYRTVLLYCESLSYQAINNAKQAVYNQNVKQQSANKYGEFEFNQNTGKLNQDGTDEQIKAYNTEVLGLQYDDEDNIMNPFAKQKNSKQIPAEQEVLDCGDGVMPDTNGCCPGEVYMDTDKGFACCPEADPEGDCFEPIVLQ